MFPDVSRKILNKTREKRTRVKNKTARKIKENDLKKERKYKEYAKFFRILLSNSYFAMFHFVFPMKCKLKHKQ